MSRIVFVVLLLFVVWRLLATAGRRRASTGLGADSYSRFHPRQRRRRMDLRDEAGPMMAEELAQCCRCGTYVPRGRAIPAGGDDVFCCESCRVEHRSEGGVDA